jgi:hypothetical protein
MRRGRRNSARAGAVRMAKKEGNPKTAKILHVKVKINDEIIEID